MDAIPKTSSARADLGVAAGLFLVSAAVLALQVLETRVLSVMMWHHHSYMVVTMTLLGFAAAGSLVTVWPGALAGDVGRRLAWCGTLFAASTVGGFALLAQTADRAAEMTARGDYFELSLFYSYLFVPYLFGGLVVTIALSAARDVHRLYFVNLVGSALGAWVFLGVIARLGAERLLVACAAAGPLAALAFLAARPRPDAKRAARGVATLAAAAALVACAALFVHAPRALPIPVASNKAETDVLARVPCARRVLERWSPMCRLDVVHLPGENGGAGLMNIYQDGDAITVMHSDASWRDEPGVALNTLAYLPHALRTVRERAEGVAEPRRPRALAIGIGGGIDLRYALDQGVASVLGIEINPVTVDLVGRELAEFNGDIYHRPGVEVRLGEGRSTLRRLDERFDVVQLSGTDTYTAGNAGAYVLSESYLYTSEAFAEYFDHLAPGGTLGMIRLAYDPPRENLRLFAIALEELRRRGVERPSRHAVVLFHEVAHPTTGEVIRFAGSVFSAEPFGDDALELFRRADEVAGYRVVYLPDGTTQGPFAELGHAIDEGRERAFYAAYPFEVAPVSDDSPFFFNFHSWSALFGGGKTSAEGWHDLTGGPIGLRILATLLLQTSALTLLLVIAPLLFLRRGGLAAPDAWRHLAYFFALGAGFMFLEISTIQRLVLFLGHPSYSLSVTLVCFLFFAGLGSLWARRYDADPARALRRIVPLLALVIALWALALEPVLAALLAWPLAARIAAVACLLAPMNFLMGMPFPLGLARLARLAPRLVPWALGANGGASVVASILCIVVAMESGFRAVSLLALAVYAGGALVFTTGPLAPARSGGST